MTPAAPTNSLFIGPVTDNLSPAGRGWFRLRLPLFCGEDTFVPGHRCLQRLLIHRGGEHTRLGLVLGLNRGTKTHCQQQNTDTTVQIVSQSVRFYDAFSIFQQYLGRGH